MSFVVGIKGSAGIVLASDTRTIWPAAESEGQYYETFDGSKKLFHLPAPHGAVGITLYGDAPLTGAPRWFGDRRRFFSDDTWVAPFVAGLPNRRLAVKEYAERLARYVPDVIFPAYPPPPPQHPYAMTLVIAGYNEGETAGRVYTCEIPDRPEPVEHCPGTVGIVYGGMREYADRLIQGYDPRLAEFLSGVEGLDGLTTQMPLARFSLQDCVDLAGFLIEMTFGVQRFLNSLGGVSRGHDVAVITPQDGFRLVQEAERREEKIESRWIVSGPPAVAEAPADILRPAVYAVGM